MNFCCVHTGSPLPGAKSCTKKQLPDAPKKRYNQKTFWAFWEIAWYWVQKKTSIFLHFLFLNKLFAVDFRGHKKFSSRKLKVLLSFFPWRRRRWRSLLACTTQPRQRHAQNEPQQVWRNKTHTNIPHNKAQNYISHLTFPIAIVPRIHWTIDKSYNIILLQKSWRNSRQVVKSAFFFLSFFLPWPPPLRPSFPPPRQPNERDPLLGPIRDSHNGGGREERGRPAYKSFQQTDSWKYPQKTRNFRSHEFSYPYIKEYERNKNIFRAVFYKR